MNLPAVAISKNGVSLGITKYLPFAMPVLSIAVSILIAYFVIWPKFGEVLSMRTTNKQMDVQAAQLEEKAQTLSSLSQDKVSLEKQLAQAEQLLPSTNGVFLVLREIELAAGSSGILLEKTDVDAKSISNIQTGTTAPAPPDKNASSVAGLSPAVVIKLSLTGGYKSFLQFMGSLYNDSRVVSIDDLSLSSSTQNNSGVVRASITINAFWKPLPKDLGSIDKPVDKLSDAENSRLSAVETAQMAQTATSSAVPRVPLGRSDLFAPF